MKKLISVVLVTALGLSLGGCGKSTAGTSPTSSPAAGGSAGTQSTALQIESGQQTVPKQAGNSAPLSIVFTWADLQTDKVGPLSLKADSKPDGHFHVTMNFSEPVKIKYIIMRYNGYNRDIQWEWVYNKSLTAVGGALGVLQNDTMIGPGTDVGFACSGTVDLDLYASELDNENSVGTIKFENGQEISLQINYVTQTGEEQRFDATTKVSL